jgi:putative resolvase
MTQSPVSASGDQPPADTGLTAQDLAARLKATGELTAEEIATLARLDDGPGATGNPCDDDAGADRDCEPPLEWLALLDGGTGAPAVAEALEAGFTHHLPGPGATGIAAAGPLCRMLGGHELAWHAGTARQRGLDELSEAELCGVMEAAQRLESGAGGLKLATVAELDARRAAPDGREGEHVTEEVAAVLKLTGRSAALLMELSRRLQRLSATAAMLAAGLIDSRRAAIIADHTAVLSAEHAVAVQDAVLSVAPGKLTLVGRERRFAAADVEAMKVMPGGEPIRLEGLYVRVSGATGQESSLAAQEAELRATSAGEVALVFRDRASGLRQDRPGLSSLLAAVADGSVTVVRVTHEDRLARFGVGWLRRLFAAHGATVEVLYPKRSGGREELLEDLISLVTTFAGRLYGMRSAEARARLLAESGQCPEGARW